MSDLDTPEGERPISEIRLASDEYQAFENHVVLLLEDLENTSKHEEINNKLSEAQQALDLGSGEGNTFVALKKLAPNLRQIDTVDVFHAPREDLVKKVRPTNVAYHQNYFNPYLQTNNQQYDIITMSYVPDHRIQTPGQYANLAKALKSGGVLLEFGDTHLSPIQMREKFELISSKGPLNLWVRK